MPLMRTPEGKAVFVSDDQVTHARDQGYTLETPGGASADLTEREKAGGGVLGGVAAGLTSAASGATLGASDVALSGLLSRGATRELGEAREAHPFISGAGQVVGTLAGSLADPASLLGRTPAGYLARATSEAVDAGKALGGARGIATAIAASGAEGAAQNAGMYLSDVALGDRDLSAEGLSGALGRGFAFGSVAGGAVLGVEKGTMAARRMFARAGAGEQAAEDAASAWERKSDEVLTAHDDTAAVARKRLDEIRQMKRDAQEMKTRADEEIARAKVEQSKAPESAPPAMPETAGPAGETQVSQTSTVTPESVSAPTSLEDQLAATKAKLDQGETLQDMNQGGFSRSVRRAAPVEHAEPLGPAVAEDEAKLTDALSNYEQRRAAVDEWVQRIKNPRTSVEAEGTAQSIGEGGSPLIRGRTSRALNEDVFVEQSGGQLRTIGKGEHSLEDLTPNSRILARSNGPEFSRGAQLDEMYQDAIERASLAGSHAEADAALHEAADIEQQIHGYVRTHKPENGAVIDKIEQLRGEANQTGYHAAFKRAEKLAERRAAATEGALPGVNAEQEAAYQEALRGTAPREPVNPSFLREFEPKNIVEQAHEAAGVLGEYEKAAADLVDAVGDAAPPAAQDAAKAYREAEAAAERKVVDRTTRAIDDHAASEPVLEPVRRSPEQRIEHAKAAKLEAKATLAKLKTEEMEVKPLARRAPAAKEPSPLRPEVQPPPAAAAKPGRFQRALGVADKVGQGLELASMAGVPGLPSPHDIPVIGPLLGMYLKFKALSSKLLGRIPATADAKAAALAARTQDRAIRAVDRMLGLVERSAPVARTAAVATTRATGEILARRIFDDGHADAPKDASPQETAAVRIRELAAAVTNPNAVIQQIRKQLAGVTDPDLIAAAEQQKLREIQYLHDNAPKEPPPSPLVRTPWTPNSAETNRLARRLEVVDDPVAALEQIERRTITPEAAETLRACYPKLFAQVQQQLLERAPQARSMIPCQQRLRMSLLFDVPLDPLLEPETIGLLQSVHKPAPATSSPAAPTQTQPPTPSVAGPIDLGKLYDADRRVARR